MLPINQIKAAVTEHLNNNVAEKKQPLIISASTGTGKSTQLPLWCADFGKVLVIEPRRIACTSLANFVASQLDTKLGDKVGYAIRFEIIANEDTAITYVTPGVALRWLYEGKLSDYNVIMLDEFHERRWDTDLLLALLLKTHAHQLIITSATLNAEQLVTYSQGHHLHAAGKAYSISEHYLASQTRDMPSKNNLALRVLAAVQKAQTLGEQDILTFLPGKSEIAKCAALLKASLSEQFEVISLHGSSPIKEQQRALVTGDKRRVILATNVAETSLTIPGINVVIDSGLERRTHIRNGQTVLDLAAIAQDSKQQRRGRAGRLNEGHYIALFGQNAPLDATTPPEIQRENLTDMMLASACNNVTLSELRFINPLSQQALSAANTHLTNIAAIDGDGRATEHGKTLYPLPIDVQLAHLISCMPNNQLKQAMVDLAAALCVTTKLYNLVENSDAHLALINEHPDLCDISLLVKLVRGQLDNILQVEPQAIAEARQYCAQLRDYFDLPPLATSASWQIEKLRFAIAANLPECVYIKRDNRRESYSNGQQEVVIARDSTLNHQQPTCLLVLKTFSLAGKAIKDRKTLATVTSPLHASVIEEAQLGYAKLKEVTLTDSSPASLVGHYDYCYANRVINAYQAPIDNPHFVEAVLVLIHEDKVCQGLFKQLQQQYELLTLYQQVNDLDWQLKPPMTHLTNVLNDLNIDCLDELALFDHSDFAYGLLTDYELEQFSARYPLEVHLPKQHLKVEYLISAKRVILHYQSGQTVDAPKKWQLPNFNGARIQYRRASKVVDIK